MKTDKLYTPEMFNEKKDTSAEEERLAEEKYFNDILKANFNTLKDRIDSLNNMIKSTKEKIKQYKTELRVSELLLEPLTSYLVESDQRIEKIESISMP